MGIHFVPKKLSEVVLNSGYFDVQEKILLNPENEIDANVIFDCRGRHNRDLKNYDKSLYYSFREMDTEEKHPVCLFNQRYQNMKDKGWWSNYLL